MSYTGRRSDVDQGKTDFTPLAGARRRQRWTRTMVHGKNRIPYRIDRRLPGLAEPDYDATISFGLPFELGDCPYGKSRLKFSAKVVSERSRRKTGKQWTTTTTTTTTTTPATRRSCPLTAWDSDRERLLEWWAYRGSASAKFCKNLHAKGNPNSGSLTRNDEFMGKCFNS